MSIATQLTALANNRDAIKAAIEAKGVADAGDTLAEFPAAIASIPSGGGGMDYGIPPDWPDIKALMEADTEDYAHKAYILFNGAAYPQVQQVLNNGGDWDWFRGSTKAITSDGATYTSAATHVWDRSKLIGGLYGWIAFYSSTGFTSVSCAINYASIQNMPLWVVANSSNIVISSAYSYKLSFQYDYAVARVDIPKVTLPSSIGSRVFFSCESLLKVPDVIDVSACTNTSSMFGDARCLKTVPSVLDLSSSTNASGMFSNCRALVKVPTVLDTSHSTNCSNMFLNCYSLEELPDTLDFSASTNNGNAFIGCFGLRKLPTHFSANYSVSFRDSIWVTDKDSVATFSGGAITGGFVGNINTCPNSGQTITLNSAIKGLFTAEEQAAIETAMDAKKWDLAW